MFSNNYMKAKYNEYSKILEGYRAIAFDNFGCYDKLSCTMDNMYKFMREIAFNFYHKRYKEMDELYRKNLMFYLKNTEFYMPNHLFIIPFKIYEPCVVHSTPHNFPKKLNDAKILSWLCHKIWEDSGDFVRNPYTFENDCSTVSEMVACICRANNIECKIVTINPGFKKTAMLYNGNNFHNICIVKLNTGYYLIDCTYRQFFTLRGNSLERIGIPSLFNSKLGIFMKMTEERISLAKTLLEHGFIKLTPENIKLYFDGFALSYRNGHYYEITKDYSYTTDYSASDYVNFLEGVDNQVNHEGEMVLRKQITPCQSKIF